MNIEQGISNDEVKNISSFDIPCSVFDIYIAAAIAFLSPICCLHMA
jgi:hypothetical protein